MTTASDPRAPCSPRYRSLDIARGLACLLVVFFHSSFYGVESLSEGDGAIVRLVLGACARGWVGVPIFFVISGYCISAAAEAHRREARGPFEYFRRRFRRIFPPYLAVLALTIAVVLLTELWLSPGLLTEGEHRVLDPRQLRWPQIVGNVTLTETWRPKLGGPESALVLGPAWSLCYEEQFYAVTGLAVVLAPRKFFPVLAGITLLSAALLASPFRRAVAWSFLDIRWFEFALGIGLYYVRNYLSRAWEIRLATATAVLSALFLAAQFRAITGAIPKSQTEIFAALAFTALSLAASAHDSRLVSSAIGRKLARVGLWTYSIYLVHWPLVKAISHGLAKVGLASASTTALLTIPLCLVLSVVAGALFHHAVERRFLNSPRSPKLS